MIDLAARAALVGVVTLISVAGATEPTFPVNLTAQTPVVGGTDMPIPAQSFMDSLVSFYVQPVSAACAVDCVPEPVPYLAQWWPLTGIRSAPWDLSVASGVESLSRVIAERPTGELVVVGYSQGAAVTGLVKRNIADQNGAAIPDRFSFVLIGNVNRPNGGIFRRFDPELPSIDAVDRSTQINSGTRINTVDIAFQYDMIADFPQYPGNVLATVNAVFGMFYYHNYTAPPYGYTEAELAKALDCDQSPEHCQLHGDTLYITLPATRLPLLAPILDLAAVTGTEELVKPFVELISPALRVIIETGYDRGDYSVASPLGLFPNINLTEFAQDFAGAIDEGIANFRTGLGADTRDASESATAGFNSALADLDRPDYPAGKGNSALAIDDPDAADTSVGHPSAISRDRQGALPARGRPLPSKGDLSRPTKVHTSESGSRSARTQT